MAFSFSTLSMSVESILFAKAFNLALPTSLRSCEASVLTKALAFSLSTFWISVVSIFLANAFNLALPTSLRSFEVRVLTKAFAFSLSTFSMSVESILFAKAFNLALPTSFRSCDARVLTKALAFVESRFCMSSFWIFPIRIFAVSLPILLIVSLSKSLTNDLVCWVVIALAVSLNRCWSLIVLNCSFMFWILFDESFDFACWILFESSTAFLLIWLCNSTVLIFWERTFRISVTVGFCGNGFVCCLFWSIWRVTSLVCWVLAPLLFFLGVIEFVCCLTCCGLGLGIAGFWLFWEVLVVVSLLFCCVCLRTWLICLFDSLDFCNVVCRVSSWFLEFGSTTGTDVFGCFFGSCADIFPISKEINKNILKIKYIPLFIIAPPLGTIYLAEKHNRN